MMEGRFGPGLKMPRNPEPTRVSRCGSGRPYRNHRWTLSGDSMPIRQTFGSRAAIECGIAFFGVERMMFGSDMPFDPEKGPGFIRETLSAIDKISLSPQDRDRILSRNGRSILGLDQNGGE